MVRFSSFPNLRYFCVSLCRADTDDDTLDIRPTSSDGDGTDEKDLFDGG